MKHDRLSTWIVTCVASVVLVGEQPACAENPSEGVPRTFIVFSNSLETLPDFLSEGSLTLVVAPADPMGATGAVQFDQDSNCDAAFNGTVWEFQNSMHVTSNGGQSLGAVAWLLTLDTPGPPPIGAITFSGPDSQILDQQVLYYEDGFDSATSLRVRCTPGGAGVMLVVDAVFSR